MLNGSTVRARRFFLHDIAASAASVAYSCVQLDMRETCESSLATCFADCSTRLTATCFRSSGRRRSGPGTNRTGAAAAGGPGATAGGTGEEGARTGEGAGAGTAGAEGTAAGATVAAAATAPRPGDTRATARRIRTRRADTASLLSRPTQRLVRFSSLLCIDNSLPQNICCSSWTDGRLHSFRPASRSASQRARSESLRHLHARPRGRRPGGVRGSRRVAAAAGGVRRSRAFGGVSAVGGVWGADDDRLRGAGGGSRGLRRRRRLPVAALPPQVGSTPSPAPTSRQSSDKERAFLTWCNHGPPRWAARKKKKQQQQRPVGAIHCRCCAGPAAGTQSGSMIWLALCCWLRPPTRRRSWALFLGPLAAAHTVLGGLLFCCRRIGARRQQRQNRRASRRIAAQSA